jgi:hypothetical protein
MKLKNLNSKLASLLLTIAIIIGTFSMSSCKKERVLSLGQEHAGGIIISLDETGQHGLIMSKEDISEDGVTWETAYKNCQNHSDVEGNWRLPTKEELILIYQDRATFNLTKNYYWSSTTKMLYDNNPHGSQCHESGSRSEYAWAITFEYEGTTGIYISIEKNKRARPVKDF